MPMDSGIEPEASSPVSFVRLSINRPAGQEPIGGLQLAVCSWPFEVCSFRFRSAMYIGLIIPIGRVSPTPAHPKEHALSPAANRQPPTANR
jgi:hypothetical protein